jgi:hypothetical protein
MRKHGLPAEIRRTPDSEAIVGETPHEPTGRTMLLSSVKFDWTPANTSEAFEACDRCLQESRQFGSATVETRLRAIAALRYLRAELRKNKKPRKKRETPLARLLRQIEERRKSR